MGEGFPPIYCPYCGHYPLDTTMDGCKGCGHTIETIMGYMVGFVHERLYKPDVKLGDEGEETKIVSPLSDEDLKALLPEEGRDLPPPECPVCNETEKLGLLANVGGNLYRCANCNNEFEWPKDSPHFPPENFPGKTPTTIPEETDEEQGS